MKKFILLMACLLGFNICFAENISDYFSPGYFITTLTSVSTGQKESDKVDIKRQYEEKKKELLTKKFPGPKGELKRCYIGDSYPEVYMLTVESHDYLILKTNVGVSLVHSESCPCKQTEEIK